MVSSWNQQMLATLHRNLLIKSRDAGHTFQEIVLPIYIISLLLVVKVLEPQMDIPGTSLSPKMDALCQSVESGSDGVCSGLFVRRAQETVLAYTPQDNRGIKELIMQVVQRFGEQYHGPALSPKGFDSEKDLLVYYRTYPETMYAALVFNGVSNLDQLPEDLHYSIRINGSYMPSTAKARGNKEDCQLQGYTCDANGYLASGFLALQSVISQVARAIALPESQCALKQNMKPSFAQQQAVPSYHRSFASTEFQLFTALYMVLALSPLLQTPLSHIVHEKETLLKDCMLMMGLRESVYWLCWLVTYALMSSFSSLILVLAAKYSTLFQFSNMGALFIIIYPYSLSMITMAFAFSTVFSKVRTATTFSGVSILCSSLLIIPIDLLHWSPAVCGILSLFSPVGLALAVDVVVRAEGRGQGLQLYNFWSTSKGANPLSVGSLVCIFIGDTLLYGIIAWYLDNTWPHAERGPKRSWGFCFSTNYWLPSRMPSSYMLASQDTVTHVSQHQLDEASFIIGSTDDTALEAGNTEIDQGDDDPNIEPVPPELTSRPAVICKDLTKVYLKKRKWWQFWAGGGGREQAHRRNHKSVSAEVVKGVNLTLYEGQLFAFVGHSNSGKTALVSMLSGLSRATSGEAYIYGLPSSEGGVEFQSLVGFCPHENIVLELLTIREQLRFFATIKGESLNLGTEAFQLSQQSKRSVTQKIEDILQELELADDADKQAMDLATSVKRKLSLAIALICDPQVVIMDQPTANMDVVSRKVFWDMLRKHQKGRVFVFTTDSMEEADSVADRKAVLSHGVVKCCGSSLFLRNRFGLSYLLHITKGATFNSSAVETMIQSHIAEAVVVPSVKGQAHATYKLPLGFSAETSMLMMDLTKNALELGVEGGALEATTLEEVFMQFQDEDEGEAGALSVHDSTSHNLNSEVTEDSEEEALLVDTDHSIMEVSSSKLKIPTLRTQTLALLRSRFTLYWRNLGSVFITFGLPVVIALGVLTAQFFFGKPDTVGLPLIDVSLGTSVPIFYSVNNYSVAHQASNLLSHFGSNHHLLKQSELLDRFDYANITGGAMDALGISFDELEFQSCSLQYTILYQPTRIHELPTVAAALDNLFLQALRTNYSGNRSLNPPSSLHVDSHPLLYEFLEDAMDFLVIMLITMGLLVVPPVLGAQVVVDKQLGLLDSFRVSGMRGSAYWTATIVSDLTLYYVTAFLILGIGLAFGGIPFIKGASLAVFFLFMTTLPALALVSYISSFFFTTAQAAASLLYIFFILSALIPYFFIIVIPGNMSYSWHSFLNVVDPPYSLISGLHFIVSSIVELKKTNGGQSVDYPPSYNFQWNNDILLSIGGAAVAILPLLMCVWQLEHHVMDPESKIVEVSGSGNDSGAEGNDESSQEDQESIHDLNCEKQRVQENIACWESMGLVNSDGQEGDLILCCGIGKNYGSSSGICGLGSEAGDWALQDLWLAVARGEVVVLVGAHKSGKSTLLQSLAGTLSFSSGDALVNGESIRYSYQNHQRFVGICPQNEALYYSMTVREHLKLFAILKGLPEPHSLAIEASLQAMHLADSMDELLSTCNVGVRRRLSIAIAMLGGSAVLLLDEASYGMDIMSRRKVWKRIATYSTQRAILICTQSFEEAEALGIRVGILVSGKLKCLASPQELKRRYGSSYSLLVMAAPDKMQGIQDFITTLFPSRGEGGEQVSSDCHTEEVNFDLNEGIGLREQCKFRVPVESLSDLAMLLHELEVKRGTLGIKDYVVSQPTLRQVFHRLSLGKD